MSSQDDDRLGDDELARVREILSDAETSARLSDWETEFCDSLRDRVLQYGVMTRISGRQWEVLGRIEGKLYS